MTPAPPTTTRAGHGELVPGPEPRETETAITLAEPATLATPATLAETAAEIEQIDVDAPRVAIVVADKEDLLTLERAENELRDRGIRSETRVMSADEEPAEVAEYTENAQQRGIRVILAGAGPAARLPSAITTHTQLPVIGVPLTSQGAQAGRLDALLSDSPAPIGEPVAWVGLDEARNAAVLAARILGSGGR
jgi:phosphoribosylaminoimidazole carboxylase PurE protein